MRIDWKRTAAVLAAVAAVALLAGCPSLLPPTEVTDDIDAATTWDGNYTISSSIYVNAVLTIRPGTTLSFAQDTSIQVTSTGSIVAVGTAADPITFTSAKTVQAAGDWYGASVDVSGSTFTYCIFEYADKGLELSGQNSVTYCTFRSNTDGLDADYATAGTVITNNTFYSNVEPLYINAAYSIDASNTFSSGTSTNTNQRILFSGDNFETSQTWSETEVPYYMDGSTNVIAGTFTIDPGVTLAFGADEYLDVEDTGKVSAVGTDGARITFTSWAEAAAGDWYGVTVYVSGSTFTYCIFEYADKGLDLSGQNSVTYCTFRSNTDGLDADYATAGTVITNNTFHANVEPLYINAAYSIDASNTFSSGTSTNTNQRILFSGDNFETSQTWSETEVPYYMDGSTNVIAGTFTIDPGVTLAFGSDEYLDVEDTGKVSAVGTDGARITFTSWAEAAAGDWYGVTVYVSGSTFTYCIFEYADTALYLSAATTVTNCEYYNCTETVVAP